MRLVLVCSQMIIVIVKVTEKTRSIPRIMKRAGQSWPEKMGVNDVVS